MAQQGRRASRKRRRRERAAKGPDYSRSRAKDEAARAALEPLAEGERPTAVTVGAIVAGLLAVANLVALVFGFQAGESSKASTTVIGALLLTVMCVGMWNARYWAVLGMQALLGITIVFGSLALVTAGNAAAALLASAVILLAGTLFWFLVKAMARIQMPERPGSK